MQIRIYESKNLDLDTVSTMLFQADSQVNFHPEARWILSSSEGETKNYSKDEPELTKRYKEYFVKWIGREAVVNWLTSNQIVFEVISHDLLPEEQEAIDKSYLAENFNHKPNQLN